MRPFWIVVLLAGLLPLTALADLDAPHVSVSGQGEVRAQPDMVVLTAVAEHSAPKLDDARKVVDQAMAKALAALARLGVAKEDTDAGRIQAGPEYDWVKGQQVLRGQRVARELTITLRDMSRYPDLVQALLDSGISRLNTPQPDFSQRKQLEQQALEIALRDARERAGVAARSLGQKLGKPWQISVQGGSPMIKHGRAMMAMDAAQESAPLEFGEQRIQQDVQVIFLLAP